VGQRIRTSLQVLREYTRVRCRYWRLGKRDLRSAIAAIRSPSDHNRTTSIDPLAEGRRLGYAVNRIVARIPGESRCLMRSLVLTSLLSRRGIPSTIVIGVSPGSAFGAHAWVELDGEPLLPPHAWQFERLVEL
jgi:hypothetical protein